MKSVAKGTYGYNIARILGDILGSMV